MSPEYIIVSNSQYQEIIHSEKIIYCKAAGSYSEIVLKDNRQLTISKNLRWIQQRLNNNTFIRVHRSYLVNIYFISKIFRSENKILLLNGIKIPLSRVKRKKLKNSTEYLENNKSRIPA